MIVWSRPAADPMRRKLCAVVRLEGPSVVTACNGRWEHAAGDVIAWEAAEGERCGGCVRELEAKADGILDPTWTGEGPRRARERQERKRKTEER